MRKILLITLLWLAACGGNDLETSTAPAIDPESKLGQKLGLNDTDGDLVSDRDERRLGTNPLIANIPTLKLHSDYKLNRVFYLKKGEDERALQISSPQQGWTEDTSMREDLINFAYDKLFGKEIERMREYKQRYTLPHYKSYLRNEDFLRMQHLLDSGFSWGRDYGAMDFQFDLQWEGTRAFKGIKNVSFHLMNQNRLGRQTLDTVTLQDSFGLPLRFNIDHQNQFINEFPVSITSKHINSKVLYQSLKGKHRIFFSHMDMDLELKDSTSIKYSDFIDQVEKKNSRLIFSTPDSYQVFYIHPKLSLKKFLMTHCGDLEINDNGNILKCQGLVSTLDDKLVLKDVRNYHRGLGRWFLIGDGEINLNYQLQAEQDYHLIYLSADEILDRFHDQNKKQEAIKIMSNSDGNTFKVENAIGGSQIEINFKISHQEYRIEEYHERALTTKRVAVRECTGRRINELRDGCVIFHHDVTGVCQLKKRRMKKVKPRLSSEDDLAFIKDWFDIYLDYKLIGWDELKHRLSYDSGQFKLHLTLPSQSHVYQFEFKAKARPTKNLNLGYVSKVSCSKEAQGARFQNPGQLSREQATYADSMTAYIDANFSQLLTGNAPDL